MSHTATWRRTNVITEPVLIAENLQRHYVVRRGLFAAPAMVRALSGVSLSLQPGRTLAVVGGILGI